MKLSIIALVLSLLSLNLFAADAAPSADKFAEHKANVLKSIDERIAAIQTEKSCIGGAANHDAIKACREAARANMKSLHMNKLDEQIKHLQMKKEEMGNKK